MNAIVFNNNGQATSFLTILNNRMLRFNENVENVGGGIHAEHLVDPLKPYTLITKHPDQNLWGIQSDDNVVEDTKFISYADYPTNTVPRTPQEGGFPAPIGDDIRTKIQNNTLVEDITSWFPTPEDII